MNRLTGSRNKLILIVMLLGVSLLTFMNVNGYKNYTRELYNHEYQKIYLLDAEDGPFGLTNKNMMLPFSNEQEHKDQAINNLKNYLKDNREQGNIE